MEKIIHNIIIKYEKFNIIIHVFMFYVYVLCSCALMFVINSLAIREKGDIGLFITLVPKVLY